MKLEKGKLKDGNVYMIKCGMWDFKSPYIWKDDLFYGDTDFNDGPCYEYDDILYIEEINQSKDTLQEVVEWCGENGTNIAVTKSKSIIIGGKLSVSELIKICDNQEQLLTHIRQEPSELTELKALAEKLGYNLSKKD